MFINLNLEYKNYLLNIIVKYLRLEDLNKLKNTNVIFMIEFEKRFAIDINTDTVYQIAAYNDDTNLLEKIVANKSIKKYQDPFYTLSDIPLIKTIAKVFTENNSYKCIKWMYINTNISQCSFFFDEHINKSITGCNLFKINLFLNIQSTRKITFELIIHNLLLLFYFCAILYFFYSCYLYFYAK